MYEKVWCSVHKTKRLINLIIHLNFDIGLYYHLISVSTISENFIIDAFKNKICQNKCHSWKKFDINY